MDLNLSIDHISNAGTLVGISCQHKKSNLLIDNSITYKDLLYTIFYQVKKLMLFVVKVVCTGQSKLG